MRPIDADHLKAWVLSWWERTEPTSEYIKGKDILDQIDREPSIDLVRCAECRYLAVQNTKYLYAICHRHGIEFKPFEDDTRTHGCSWGERKGSVDERANRNGVE